MGTYLVRGGKRIEGEFAVRGSKNAALPILAACVLAADEVVLENLPQIRDVSQTLEILRELGCSVTLNKKTKQISMTSFMRDLYVQIPGYSDNRINAAYAFGGMDLLDSTLNTNFGVEIVGNVEVDFGEFQTLIDSIGGIDLELTQDEADYICGRKRDVTYPQQLRTDWNLHEGVNHLTGEQALIHARNRSLGNDYARTDRQRAVLMAIINKVKQMDAVSIVNFINQVLPLLTTDMTSGEILGYAMEALQMNFDSEHSYRIPAEGTYTGAVIRGMQVLVPDLAANQTYLMDVLYHTDNNQ